uniref:Uncharacterized protein n=1 Tax=Arundo donax TaxID=35708 RepID=A0A0A9F0U2_ARUDO
MQNQRAAHQSTQPYRFSVK